MKSQIIWTIALLIQFYKLSKLFASIKSIRQLIQKLSALKILSVSQLKNKIMQGVYNVGDLILCNGVISTDQQLKSYLNKNIKVAYSELVVQKVFQIGETRNIVRKQLGRLMGGFMRIKGGGDQIKMFETVGAQFLPTKYLKKTVSYNQKIFNLGWFLSLLLKSPTRVVSNAYTQSMIPQNTEVTILSRIASQNPEISHPLAIGNSREHILSFYSEQLDNHKFLFYSLIVCIALSTIFFYKLCLKPFYLSMMASKQNNNLNKIQKIYVKSFKCALCEQKLSAVIHSPCGHFAVCAECWELRGGEIGKCCSECQSKTNQNIIVFPC